MNRNASPTAVGDQESIESLLETSRNDGDFQRETTPFRVETGESTPVSPIRLNATAISKQHPSRLLQPKVRTPRKDQSASPDGAAEAIIAKKQSPNKNKDLLQANQTTTEPKRRPSLNQKQTVPTSCKTDLRLPTSNPRSTPPRKKAPETCSPKNRAKIAPLPNVKLTTFKLNQEKKKTDGVSPKEEIDEARIGSIMEQREVLVLSSTVSTHNHGETSSPKNVSSNLNSQSCTTTTYMRHFHQEFDIDYDESLLSEDSDLDEVEDESMVGTTSDDRLDWAHVDPGNDEDIKSTATKEEDMSVDTEGQLFDMVDADLLTTKNSESRNVKGGEPTDVMMKARYLDDLAEVDSSKSALPSSIVETQDLFEKVKIDGNFQSATPKIENPCSEKGGHIHTDSTQVDPLCENGAPGNEWPPLDGEVHDHFHMAEAATVHTRNTKRVANTEGARKNTGYRKNMDDHERTERTDEDLSGRSTDLDDTQAWNKGKVERTATRRSFWCCCCLP